jgi:hypothetical protein
MKINKMQNQLKTKFEKDLKMKADIREKQVNKNTMEAFTQEVNNLTYNFKEEFNSQAKLIENEFEDKYREQYNKLLLDYKAKIREDEISRTKQGLYESLKSNLTADLYNKQYSKIEEEYTNQLEGSIKNDIFQRKVEEIEKLKKTIETFQTIKSKELEQSFKDIISSEYQSKFDHDIKMKEKAIEALNLRKLESFKSKLESQLREDHEKIKRKLMKEVIELKSQFYSKQCGNKLKKKNRSVEHQGNFLDNLKVKFENEEKLEKALNKEEKKPLEESPIYINNNFSIKNRKFVSNKLKNDINKEEFFDNMNHISTNIAEVNRKLKSFSNIEQDFINNNKRREISLIFNDNYHSSSNTLQDELDQIIQKCLSHKFINNKPKENENEKEIHTYKGQNFLPTTQSNVLNLNSSKECLSLAIDEKTPISMKDFGKFIVNYIEKENDCKKYYDSNQIKVAKVIKKKFSIEIKEHGLLSFTLDLWEKLSISYKRRCSILLELMKIQTPIEIYTFLDRESDILSVYYEKSKDIYNAIEIRERMKSKMQAKLNRSKLPF